MMSSIFSRLRNPIALLYLSSILAGLFGHDGQICSPPDGEKQDRNRDAEFVGGYESKEALVEVWDKAWNFLLTSLSSFTPDVLDRNIKIRREDYTVLQSIQRQLAHHSNHVGQIVYIGKMIKNEDWKTLSIAKGKSEEYLQE